MIFQEKYFSCYILLTDQISLGNMLIICFPVDDKTDFEINLSFLINSLFYMTTKS